VNKEGDYKVKIGILTTTVREGRNSLKVANWVLENGLKRNDGTTYEIVDLKDFDLPIMGLGTSEQFLEVSRWQEKIAEFDGYIIITAEYNHAPSGVFKNALDFLKPQFADKVASFVGYGGVGGARAIEQLKLVFSEYQVATTQRQVNLMLMVDFINMSEFAPKDYQLDSLEELFVQTNKWAKALKTIR
jgi:NAD(P)H-dependent FMN reductase